MRSYPETATTEVVQPFASEDAQFLHRFYDGARYFGLRPPPTSPFWAQILAAHAEGLTGKGQTIAVLDTGVMSAHPVISARLVRSVCMNDGSPEDVRGHGTAVALIALLAAPDAQLVNVKIIDDSGSGSIQSMVRGLRWAADNGIRIINLSAGIYSRRWLFLDCDGTCEVCEAAVEVSSRGCILSVAAGNKAGETSCPATVGRLKPDAGISVAAFDESSLTLKSYSGTGDFAAPDSGYEIISL